MGFSMNEQRLVERGRGIMTVEQSEIVFIQKDIPGDMVTPISLYHSLYGKKKILFESSAKHEESGRYSFVAANPVKELISTAQEVVVVEADGTRVRQTANAFDVVRQLIPGNKGQLPFSFYGGAIGYIGYETAFYHEQIGDVLEDEFEMPDMHLLFFDRFIVFDHVLQKLSVVAIDLFHEGKTLTELEHSVDSMIHQIEHPTLIAPQERGDLAFTPAVTAQQFCEMVEQGQQYIKRGDIFQIVLSQRFSAPFNGNPMGLYRKLRLSNPSPYMYYLDFDGYTILGTSPESLVKVNNRFVTTNPIAGTRKRGKTDAEDRTLATELLNDEKELAEHRMLVDLGRNDIGRLAKVGTVSVNKYMKIERYKYVMHIVSEVTGELCDDVHPIDVLRVTLPAGTVSGAPKIRAMQLINGLESTKRGVYAGAVGYLSVSGDLDMALAIRTMVVTKGKAHVQAGAGIVYNSVPMSEYEETINKAKALLEVRDV